MASHDAAEEPVAAANLSQPLLPQITQGHHASDSSRTLLAVIGVIYQLLYTPVGFYALFWASIVDGSDGKAFMYLGLTACFSGYAAGICCAVGSYLLMWQAFRSVRVCWRTVTFAVALPVVPALVALVAERQLWA